MKEIVAPNEDYSSDNFHNVKVFLAGGITNCPDWQREFVNKINNDFPQNYFDEHMAPKTYDALIYNPRREIFDINDKLATEIQIGWEYKHLIEADIVVFWFSAGSENPIVLYEYGFHGLSESYRKDIIVGVDPNYSRKVDVESQTKLFDPDIIIYNNLDQVASNLIDNIRIKQEWKEENK